MLSSEACKKKYGLPKTVKANSWMEKLIIPHELETPGLPDTIYCNKDFSPKFLQALDNLKKKNLLSEFKVFGGCYAVRNIRGGSSYSLHSWGIAIDINPAENPLQKNTKICRLSKDFILCFKQAGFDWGGDFKSRFDPMHFQLAQI